ncbi:hypothetical protein NL529_30805, partial [Klebsiella pneumoniae]|nr:hypothetical protein [Klebsiella pneumoniae]
EDGVIGADQFKRLQGQWPRLVPYERTHLAGSYYSDYLGREAKSLTGLEPFKNVAYTIRSTIDPQLQRATEAALQEGLAQYEIGSG